MKCSKCKRLVGAYLDGELGEDVVRRIETHLAACPACRARHEEIRRLKENLCAAASERLTASERIFLEQIIRSTRPPRRSLREIFPLIPRPAILISAVTVTLFVMVALLYAYLVALDRKNDLLVAEIMQVHESTLPDEFSTEKDLESALRKNLDIPNARVPRFVKERPVVKARFSHLGKQPVASMRITGAHGGGTLLISRPHEDLKKIFEHGACVPDHLCRAQRLSRHGKDMLFWEEAGNTYLFVADDHRTNENLARLIATDEF